MKDYGLKYKAMFMTVYGGGLRVSELCNLRIQDILHLQKLLGHSGIRSTMEYLHLANVEKDIVNPLDRLYGAGDKNA